MVVHPLRLSVFILGSLICFNLLNCAGAPRDPQMVSQCKKGLDTAFQELEQAKTNGFSGSVNWSKAATLLSAAKMQQQFDKYPNCLDKIKRARFYITESQKT